MRASGVVHSPRALHAGDHICWVYDDPASFEQAVVDFLADGLRQGERLALLTSTSLERARHLLGPLGDVGDLVDRGALEIDVLSDASRHWVDSPGAQAEHYARATRSALAGGYRGLRLAVDMTPLAADPALRAAVGDHEALVDRYVAEHALTALCGYDRRTLGAGLTEIVCLHPVTNLDGVVFQLSADDQGGLRLAGEIDTFTVDAFAVALRHAIAGHPGTLAVDGRDLDFINHRGLATLDTAADTVDLRTRFSVAATVAELLELAHLDVHVEG